MKVANPCSRPPLFLIALSAALALANCEAGGGSERAGGRITRGVGLPTITSFSPVTGGLNTVVTITGTNLTGVTTVRFNGTASSVVTVVSDTQLTARVPDGAMSGPISVSHPTDGTATSAEPFTVPFTAPPVITALSASHGLPGTSLTIDGEGFAGASVRFGSTSAAITSNTGTQLVVTVPPFALATPVVVTTPGGSASSPGSFTVVPPGPPTVSTFSPAGGATGTFVTIDGTNLGAATEVSFGGVPAISLTLLSATRVRATLPAGARSGTISVRTPLGAATSANSFTVTSAPRLLSFSPRSGAPGQVVTITGDGMSAVTGVTFNNTNATFTVVSPTQVDATVPAGASSGAIGVRNAAGNTTTLAWFFVTSAAAPTITGFTPASGTSGTLTVTGTNFTGTQAVYLGHTGVTNFTLTGDATLAFSLPQGAQTGRIRVINTEGEAISAEDFVVGAAPPPPGAPPPPDLLSFTPTSGANGSLVTLHGSGFTGSTAVTFGGVASPSFTVVSDTEVRAVVPVLARSGTVRVVHPSGAVTSSGNFTVEGAAAPVIHALSPTFNTQSVTITGSHFTGVTSVTFNGVEARSFSLTSDGKLTAVTPLVPFTSGTVRVTNSAGSTGSAEPFVVSPPPVIASISPATPVVGEELTVTGSGFLRVRNVTLSQPAYFRIISDTELRVHVPPAVTREATLVLGTATESVSSSSFTLSPVAPPTLLGLSVTEANRGTAFEIYGNGFSALERVLVGGAPATSITLRSSGVLNVTVPPTAVSGPVTVESAAGTATSPEPLTIPTVPTVTAFSPAAGPPGAAVTVQGTGFLYARTVTFGGRQAPFYVVSDTELVARVPAVAKSGPIGVGFSSGSGQSLLGFTVQSSCAPVITTFDPTSGGANTFVNIDGACFTGTTAVRFAGVESTLVNIVTDNRISARVPAGITTGPISVINTLGTASSPTDFVFVPPPTVATFSPDQAAAGQQFTLTGTALGATTRVTMGNVQAAFTVVDDGALTVTVPLGAVSGPVRVETRGGTVTSSISFAVQSTEPPAVSSFSPLTAGAGTSVVLQGAGFTGLTSVTFNGARATTVNVISDTQLSAQVPSGASTGPITVTNTAGAAASAQPFTFIPAPQVAFFTPTRGLPGTTVTVAGAGFTGANVVELGYRPASFTLIDDTRLTFTVPLGSETAWVRVRTPGGSGQTTAYFEVLSPAPPQITSISPLSGTTSTAITVTGTGFTGATKVSVGGVETTSYSVNSDTELQFYVPSNATTGRVTVTNSMGTASSPQVFTLNTSGGASLTAPTFTPTQGVVGTPVTLRGSALLSGTNRVTFNGTAAGFEIVADDEVVAWVPPGATTGRVEVSGPTFWSSQSTPFTVLASEAPSLAGFSPAAGRPDTVVTLTGSGFSGTERVLFGGVPASAFVGDDDGTLRVAVPAAAQTGPITVSNRIASAVSSEVFTIIPALRVTGFSPASGPPGTVVTITGVSLDQTASVEFNGLPAPFTLVSETELTATVPAMARSGYIVLRDAATRAVFAPTDFQVTSTGAPALSGLLPTHGPVGAQVLLTGTGLRGVTSVTFGAVGALFTTWSDEALTALVPPGAGSGPITVTSALGSASSAGFTVDGLPALSSFSPPSGSAGTSVSVDGVRLAEVEQLIFSGAAGAAFSVVDDNQLSTSVPWGAVSGPLTVHAPAGSAQSSGWFAVPSTSAPTVTDFAPSRVARRGRLDVYGTGFAGATEVRVNGTPVESFTIKSDGHLEAVVSPVSQSGVVSVSNGLGTAWSEAILTVVPPPVIASFSPSSGAPGSTVALTGSNLGEVTSVAVETPLGSLSVPFVVDSDSQITVTLHGGLASGRFGVASPGGVAFSSGAFTVLPALSPLVGALSPELGAPGTLVLINGSGMTAITEVRFNGVASPFVSPVGNGLQVYATVPAGATTGRVTVTNALGSGESPIDFTVTGASNQPSLTSMTPTAAPRGATITLQGSNLDRVTQVVFSGGFTSPKVLRRTATELEVVVPEYAVSGVVYVSNGNGIGLLPFTVAEPPRILSVSPPVGLTNQTIPVTLTGTGFGAGTVVRLNGVVASGVTVVNSSTLQLTLPSRGTPQTVDLQVSNPDGLSSTLLEGFTYLGPLSAPTVSAVSPATGPLGGGTVVTVSGTGFVSGAAVSFGALACTGGVVQSPTTLRCVTPAGAEGPVDVRVQNVDGQSGNLTGGFTYVGPPTLTAVAPDAGPATGGTAVTLTGTGFQEGATVTFGGQAAASVALVSDTALTAVTPARAAGAVDVIVRNSDGQTATLSSGFTFEAAPPPAVISVSPVTGPASGGTQVAITGTGFVDGATVSLGGAAAAGVTFVTSTMLTAVTGARAPGAVSVDVRNPDGQTGSLAGGFTYEPVPAPEISTVSPGHGPTSGATLVTVSGAHFQQSATVRFGATLGTITAVSATELSVRTPARATIGPVDVVVTNGDGQSATAAAAFTYDWGAAPTVTSISPREGLTAGGTAVSIGGSDFVSGAMVTIGGVPATNVVRVSASQLTATTAARSAGTVDVVVQNSDGQTGTLSGGYTYQTPPPLTLASVSPVSGAATGGTTVTLTGTGFTAGATVAFGAVAATGVDVASETSLTAVTPAQPPGAVSVTVTLPDSQTVTLPDAFTYEPAPAPVLTAVLPSSGPTTGGTVVALQGQNFVEGASVRFDGVAAPVSFGSSTSLTATTPASAAGTVDVEVENPDGQASIALDAFTFVAAPAPTVTGVTPNIGPTTGGTSVSITGTDLVEGAQVRFGDVEAAAVVFGSTTSLTAQSPAHVEGTVEVAVVNPDGQSGALASAFTFGSPPAPLTLGAVLPAQGPTVGGTDVTLQGTGFAPGATVRFDGVTAEATVASGTSISARTPAHAAGPVDVEVDNGNGEVAVLNAAFTYEAAPAPTVGAVSPSQGSVDGGLRVTLSGAHFAAGATVRFGDSFATNVTVDSNQSISATTPRMAPGAVAITVTNPDGQQGTRANAFTFATNGDGEGEAEEPPAGCGGCASGGGGGALLGVLGLLALGGRRRRSAAR